MASPPLTWPIKAITMLIRRSADCPRVMMSAARMNMGTAISDAGRMPPIICWMNVCIWPKPSNIITKPTTAAVVRGIIIGKPISSSPIMIIIIIVAMARVSLCVRVHAASDLGFGVGVAIDYPGRQVDVFAGEVFNGREEVLGAGDGKAYRCPYIDPPDREAQSRQNPPPAVQGFDVAVGVVTQKEQHHGSKQGDNDHQCFAPHGGEGIVQCRHPDMAAVASGIADPGKSNQDDENPVYLTGEEHAFAEDKAGDDISAGVECHQDNADGQDDRFHLGYPLVDGPQKPGQTGLIRTGVVFNNLLGMLRHGKGTPIGPFPAGVAPGGTELISGPARRRPGPPPGAGLLVFFYSFEVFLELLKQFLAALTGHLDEFLLDLRRPLPEGVDLFLVQACNRNLVTGGLDFLKGFVGKPVDVLDDFFEGIIGGIADQLLVFFGQAIVEVLVGHHRGGKPAVAG